MARQRLMFMVVVVSWIGVSVVPTRADCPFVTLEDQFARSQAVFIGRAIAQQIVPINARSGTRATETTFAIEQLWKGRVNPKTLRVRTCSWNDGNNAVTCGESLTIVVGSRYIVFAIGDPLETSQCQPTALAERAEKTLQWLSGKPRK
jgi:hypothetical protein